ncbi:MAG: hypothetical protein JXA15_09695 [Spirochaetales bacterium]|nr:hypothetical protein [Spirochaetales bacterium]
MRRIQAGMLALALFAVGIAAFAEETRTVALTVEATQLRSSAAASGKVILDLPQGTPLRVLEKGTTVASVAGRKAPWHKVATVDGTEGFVFGAAAEIADGPLAWDDLGDDELWMDYLELALRPGERVFAVDSFGGVTVGMEGYWYPTEIDRSYEDAFLVVWDEFLDASIYAEYVPEDFPRMLTARSWWVPGNAIEIAGEEGLADFLAMEGEYIANEDPELLVTVGSAVVLGAHTTVDPADPASLFWDDGMNDYVGEEATVTEHVGRDKWGYAIVHVDADDGTYYWRLADMFLVERYVGDGDGSGSGDYAEYSGYADEGAGMIKVGSVVVLGKHDDGAGEFDINWADEMESFVGKRAKVTEFVGSDSDGFIVVAVEGNDFVWRVRNLTLFGRGRPGSYGYKLGDRVVVGKHRPLGESQLVFWVDEMEQYVGMEATITELVGQIEDELSRSFYVRLDVDGGEYFWRVETLSPVE